MEAELVRMLSMVEGAARLMQQLDKRMRRLELDVGLTFQNLGVAVVRARILNLHVD